jgi:hypothetical protein
MQLKPLSIMAISLAALALLGGKCTPPAPPSTGDQAATESQSSHEQSTVQAPPAVSGVEFVAYQNKAMNYSLERPDRWYWRHYLGSQIKEAAPGVEDYFITDPAPLPALNKEHLGNVVVEVSKRALTDYATAVSGLAERSVTVAGESATRYEGERDGSKIIEYHFTHAGYTYRLRYEAATSAGHEAVFEHVVASLGLGS